MSFVAAAVVGAAGINAVVSSRNASRATESAERQSEAQLAFERERYEDWLEVYGPIQDNLAEYYNSLTPEYYEARGIEAFEQERADVMREITANLAQRGITDSGIAARAAIDLETSSAIERANIRERAPRAAAEEQRQFLQIGLGQDPSDSISAALRQETGFARQRQSLAEQSSAAATGNLITTAGTALVDYLQRPQTNPGAA